MKHRKTSSIAWVMLCVTLLVAAPAAFAQVSANYDLRWTSFTSGGGTRSSANYAIQDTLGQWSYGTSTSESYTLNPVFWTNDLYKVFLPLITREFD